MKYLKDLWDVEQAEGIQHDPLDLFCAIGLTCSAPICGLLTSEEEIRVPSLYFQIHLPVTLFECWPSKEVGGI